MKPETRRAVNACFLLSELNENVPIGAGWRMPSCPHMETLTMSRKERKRMTIMAGVKSTELSQVQAAELMGLGYRQAKRLWRRCQEEGDAGLIHRLRGRRCWRVMPRRVTRTSARRRWPRRESRWITTRCGGGCWRRGNGPCAGGSSSTGNGRSACRVSGSPGSKVVLCLHPDGHHSVLAAPPDPQQKPALLFTNHPNRTFPF